MASSISPKRSITGKEYLYYSVHSNAEELTKKEKIWIKITSILIGLYTLGLFPLACHLAFKNRKASLLDRHKDDLTKRLAFLGARLQKQPENNVLYNAVRGTLQQSLLASMDGGEPALKALNKNLSDMEKFHSMFGICRIMVKNAIEAAANKQKKDDKFEKTPSGNEGKNSKPHAGKHDSDQAEFKKEKPEDAQGKLPQETETPHLKLNADSQASDATLQELDKKKKKLLAADYLKKESITEVVNWIRNVCPGGQHSLVESLFEELEGDVLTLDFQTKAEIWCAKIDYITNESDPLAFYDLSIQIELEEELYDFLQGTCDIDFFAIRCRLKLFAEDKLNEKIALIHQPEGPWNYADVYDMVKLFIINGQFHEKIDAEFKLLESLQGLAPEKKVDVLIAKAHYLFDNANFDEGKEVLNEAKALIQAGTKIEAQAERELAKMDCLYHKDMLLKMDWDSGKIAELIEEFKEVYSSQFSFRNEVKYLLNALYKKAHDVDSFKLYAETALAQINFYLTECYHPRKAFQIYAAFEANLMEFNVEKSSLSERARELIDILPNLIKETSERKIRFSQGVLVDAAEWNHKFAYEAFADLIAFYQGGDEINELVKLVSEDKQVELLIGLCRAYNESGFYDSACDTYEKLKSLKKENVLNKEIKLVIKKIKHELLETAQDKLFSSDEPNFEQAAFIMDFIKNHYSKKHSQEIASFFSRFREFPNFEQSLPDILNFQVKHFLETEPRYAKDLLDDYADELSSNSDVIQEALRANLERKKSQLNAGENFQHLIYDILEDITALHSKDVALQKSELNTFIEYYYGPDVMFDEETMIGLIRYYLAHDQFEIAKKTIDEAEENLKKAKLSEEMQAEVEVLKSKINEALDNKRLNREMIEERMNKLRAAIFE